jgi:hypothetical protein
MAIDRNRRREQRDQPCSAAYNVDGIDRRIIEDRADRLGARQLRIKRKLPGIPAQHTCSNANNCITQVVTNDEYGSAEATGHNGDSMKIRGKQIDRTTHRYEQRKLNNVERHPPLSDGKERSGNVMRDMRGMCEFKANEGRRRSEQNETTKQGI